MRLYRHDHLFLIPHRTPFCCTDVMILTVKDVESNLDTLATHLQEKMREINPTQNQDLRVKKN